MHIPNLKDAVDPQEWALRCDLAACYRLVALHGWSDLVFTHISAKLPLSLTGGDHQFLINPYGLTFDEITASSLVKVDAECNKLSESPFPVNPAGFVIHSAVHEERPDAGCVLHTHTRAGVAVSAQEHGVLPMRACSRYFCTRVVPRRGGMQGGGARQGFVPCLARTTPQRPRLGATLRAGGLGGALPRCSPLVVETTTARPAPRIASAQPPGAGAQIV